MAPPSPEQSLYDSAIRWSPVPGKDGTKELIDAAVQALCDGLDSPTLRLLAGASPTDRGDEIQPLLEAALDELAIPQPGTIPPWQRIVCGGTTFSRLPTDRIRFDIEPSPNEVIGGFQLLVYVNEVELTASAAGMGMDPFDILIPANQLVATAQPRVVPIVRGDCGAFGCCDSQAVTIVRDGASVHWDWHREGAIDRGLSFLADEYDAEVSRIGRAAS